jgi:PhnB protein
MGMPDLEIGHAEVEIGGSIIIIGDELPGGLEPSPRTLGGRPCCSCPWGTAMTSSSKRLRRERRSCKRRKTSTATGVAMSDDPLGHRWNIASHIEELAPQEMKRRAAQVMGCGLSIPQRWR